MEIEQKPTRVINHKSMRKTIGLIAFSLPLLVIPLSGRTFAEMQSISISYWTYAGDIFVGSLVAVAFFLFAYNGTGDCRRDIASHLINDLEEQSRNIRCLSTHIN